MDQLKKFWHWLWHDDSVLSWVTSILIAFIAIKYVIYPLLGLLMGTQFPIVAVVSDSMEHNQPFDQWWAIQQDHYLRHNITMDDFQEFPMPRGFDKGDIIVLVGVAEERVEPGDIIVYWGGKAYPIIHRVIAVNGDGTFQTKGDNNPGQIIQPPLDERRIPYDRPCLDEADGTCDIVLGKAVFRVPWLGWVKIWAVDLLRLLGLPVA